MSYNVNEQVRIRFRCEKLGIKWKAFKKRKTKDEVKNKLVRSLLATFL